MNEPVIRGTVLSEAREGLGGARVSRVILLIVDGMRADAFERAWTGSLPGLTAALGGKGFLHYRRCVTTFPSVTVSAHSSLLTGTYPGFHGIVGNEWFIRKAWAKGPGPGLFRVTREYVKYAVRHAAADPGLANGFMSNEFFNLANADLYPVPTLYEAFPGASAAIHEMISQGATEKLKLHFKDILGLSGYLATGLAYLFHKLLGERLVSFPHHGFDRRGFEKLWALLARPTAPAFTALWLPAMDGFSHWNGAENQPRFFERPGRCLAALAGSFDRDMAKTMALLRRRGMDRDTLVVITADHGHYDADPARRVTADALYRFLREDPALAGEAWPLTPQGRVDDFAREAGAVLSLNGGSCYVYVRGKGGWGDFPSTERLAPFLRRLAEHPAVEIVLFRGDDGGYRWWRDGRAKDLSSLPKDFYPLAQRRLERLAPCRRAGDIILSARAPFAFSPDRYRGQHGRLNAEDSLVPLFFIHPSLPGTVVDREVETVDLAPTLAELAGDPGRYFRLRPYGEERRRKLDQLLETLEAHLKSSLYRLGRVRGAWRLWGRYPRREFRKDLASVEADLKNNIAQKLSHYRERELLDPETLDAYQSRYEALCGLSK